MDSAISLAIVLFILSMINERIANFIKLQFSNKKLLWVSLGNLRDKGTPAEEDDRSKRIIGLNIACGTVVALCFRADLITIVNHIDNPSQAIGWDKPFEDHQYFTLLIGCLLTGCFLSLGSKFWHDLLDILFQAKNLKEKMADEQSLKNIRSLGQLDEFINIPQFKLAELAYEKYGDEIGEIPGVESVWPGYISDGNNGKSCLEVHFSDAKAMASVHDEYKITIKENLTIAIPVKKLLTGVAKLQVKTFGAGSLTANSTEANGWGSIACVVKKKDDNTTNYLLSCFHVLSSNPDLNEPSEKNDINCKLEAEEIKIGVFSEGGISESLDCALALITNNQYKFDNSKINDPKHIRKVTSTDSINKTPVKMYGGEAKSLRTGFIIHDSWPQPFQRSPRNVAFTNLVKISSNTGPAHSPISLEGDSGSLLVDNNNVAIGIVVGADDFFTYAIKMSLIEKKLEIKLA